MDAAWYPGTPVGSPAASGSGDDSLRGGPEIPAGLPRPGGQPGERAVPPEVVVVPAHPGDGRGERADRAEVLFETRADADGRDVLPVFSSVRRLVEAFGPAQPWVALKLRTAREVAASGGLADVLIDPVVPPGAWRWDTRDLDTLERGLGGPRSTDDPRR